MRALNLRVSLVIPAFNEEEHLPACLDAISRQTVKPYEVIVVDNNSTDNTVAIARNYPFVKVINEPRQGVVFARDAGFNAARGEVIGRIDVDTLLSPNWIQTVQQIFADQNIDAVSGSLNLHDVPFKKFFSAVDLFFRRYLAKNLNRRHELFLFGGNMAITQQFWRDMRTKVCHKPEFHEDIDMAAHAAHSHWRIKFCEELKVGISGRRIDSPWTSLYGYSMANPRTYRHHKLKSRFYMYVVIWPVLLFFPLLRALYRSYDPVSDKIHPSMLVRPSKSSRISPISDY
jgi:glycosyltransferase involved in cell wall biosynthesis